MSMNPRTGRPFINPRFADFLSEPELFGLGRKPSPEADAERVLSPIGESALGRCKAVQSESRVTSSCFNDDRRCVLSAGHDNDHEGYCSKFEGPFWFTDAEKLHLEELEELGVYTGPCKECGISSLLVSGLCLSCDYAEFARQEPRMATRMSFGPSYAGVPVKTEQELAEYQEQQAYERGLLG